ncbi:MAG: peptidylprolyl isomerase [Planctomycetes bacterium]|nr:peptidylprolyl isomerase [Planctomycetota bacterium]
MTTCAVWSDARLARLRNTLAILETPQGKITLEFFPEDAPFTVSAFVNRVRAGGYDGGGFHRVIKGFMMQGGDPRMDGTGDAGYKLAQEFSARPHAPGIVSMARSAGPDSAGCQFFICFGTPAYLDRAYTAFGRVIEGMDTVKTVETVRTFGPPGDAPIEPVTLIKAVLAERPSKQQE